MNEPQQPDPSPATQGTASVAGNNFGIVIGFNTGTVYQFIIQGVAEFFSNKHLEVMDQVQKYWIEGIYRQALYREAWAPLRFTIDPQAVTHGGRLAQSDAPTKPEDLPPGITITDLFEQANQKLLILGAPGSGKTTLLLEIAEILVQRARADKYAPIPVIFNLSSWGQQRQPLDAWLREQLNIDYDVDRRTAHKWLAQGAILPLLDGLDEVREDYRAECVEAINTFLANNEHAGVVVCSRLNEFRNLEMRLKLRQAVVVQPLTEDQMRHYLEHAGAPLDGVRAILDEDARLRQLACVPLFLNMMAQAYQHASPDELRGLPQDEQHTRLFTRYVDQMLARLRQPKLPKEEPPYTPTHHSQRRKHRPEAKLLTGEPPYTPTQTKRWLGWLAQQMHQHNQSIFYLEQLQASWLPTQQQQLLVKSCVACVTALLSTLTVTWLILNLLQFSLDFMDFNPHVDALINTLITVVLFGAFLGIGWSTVRFPNVIRAEGFIWSWASSRQRIGGSWFLKFIIFGFVIVMPILLGLGIGVALGWTTGILFGSLTASIVGAILLLLTGVDPIDVFDAKTRPNEGTIRALRTSMSVFAIGFGGTIVGITLILLLGWLLAGLHQAVILNILMSNMSWIWMVGGIIFFFAWLFFGGVSVLTHYLLRIMLSRADLAPAHPLHYPHFLDYAVERVLLRRMSGGYMFFHGMLLEHFAKHHAPVQH